MCSIPAAAEDMATHYCNVRSVPAGAADAHRAATKQEAMIALLPEEAERIVAPRICVSPGYQGPSNPILTIAG
jgi:hypothetical protein